MFDLPLADPAFYGYDVQSFRTSVIWTVACKYIYVPKYLTTVDGWNPAPPGMYETL